MTSDAPLIEVKNLKTYFRTESGIARAVDGVSLSIASEKTLGVVGESGCGKSVTARSIMALIQPPGRIEEGEILFRRNGEVVDLAKFDPKGRAIRNIRGNDIAMIFQEPMTSLNPVFTIGDQVIEGILLHQGVNRSEARRRAIDMLDAVAIPSPKQRINEYPHQLSGGMRQRAMIAMALSCNPALLIADEPTTALDVTIQAQVIELMRQLQQEFKAAIMFITHDLGVIADVADEVIVMYLGKVVERAPVREIFHNFKHPYTEGLMNSLPALTQERRERLVAIEGNVPSPYAVPKGCGFAPRCPHAMEKCHERAPDLIDIGNGHLAACYLNESVTSEARV
jgi:oligopeptide/dipeptide ABC transporter ATP-binding protein